MGVYNYMLSTQKRTVMVNGKPEDIHKLKFDGKESGWGNHKPHELARAARIENIWQKRDWPKYVAHDIMSDGDPVYEGIRACMFSEYYFDNLILAGRIRRPNPHKPNAIAFQPYHRIFINIDEQPSLMPSIQAADRSIYMLRHIRNILSESGLIKGEFHIRRLERRRWVCVHTVLEEDIVMAKMAIASHEIIVIE